MEQAFEMEKDAIRATMYTHDQNYQNPNARLAEIEHGTAATISHAVQEADDARIASATQQLESIAELTRVPLLIFRTEVRKQPFATLVSLKLAKQDVVGLREALSTRLPRRGVSPSSAAAAPPPCGEGLALGDMYKVGCTGSRPTTADTVKALTRVDPSSLFGALNLQERSPPRMDHGMRARSEKDLGCRSPSTCCRPERPGVEGGGSTMASAEVSRDLADVSPIEAWRVDPR
ncbi:unnamed protein product [Prorocentrum cordatum]|uniref:Prohibitin n=1 Tax=Prorocentrum cordatum TaxID=2364126 RepID=A0ABN9V4M2_9DINO|nr:unnamed protein product [Polarella glacialis]